MTFESTVGSMDAPIKRPLKSPAAGWVGNTLCAQSCGPDLAIAASRKTGLFRRSLLASRASTEIIVVEAHTMLDFGAAEFGCGRRESGNLGEGGNNDRESG